MANLDNAQGGFRPYTSRGGRSSPQAREHALSATNAAIGVGSPVVVVAAGVDHAAAGAGNSIFGIAAEFKAANSGGDILIWDDPDQEYSCQTDDGTGTATALGALKLNIDFIGAGVSNQQSTAELDQSSADVGATIQFRIVRLSNEFQRNDVNAFGEFNRLIVRINTYQDAQGTGASGSVGV